MSNPIPLALYIHIPWCVRKCPYCDFNSHSLKTALPEQEYIRALLQDLTEDLPKIENRVINSIFIGGGTPSLLSPEVLNTLIEALRGYLSFAEDIEISLEANPGTVEQVRFQGFRQAGINRLSLGIQSFQADKLKALGRIHDDQEAIRAVEAARNAGFENFNLDLMFGLPKQTIDDALADLQTAISLRPAHISWYQLTLEPNTLFYRHPPSLPVDDTIWEMQTQGQRLLSEHNFQQYEISAYSQPDLLCRHNLNYWQFGDYLGIGAGAHAKITDFVSGTITRFWKTKHPSDYLNSQEAFIAGCKVLNSNELPLEFMMNAMRLFQPIPLALFKMHTGLALENITQPLIRAQQQGLLEWDTQFIRLTEMGRRYLNDVLEFFLFQEL